MSDAPIKFRFNEAKATEAAAWLLKREQGRMNYLRLIKLLYIADRESLTKFGRPITGDDFVSMKKGPVLSNVLHIIRDDGWTEPQIWPNHIEKNEDYTVHLVKDPGADNLSAAETDLLDVILASHWGKTQWEMVDYTHTFPEWKDPGHSVSPIHVEELLRAAGVSDEKIDKIREDASEDAFLDELLGT